MICCVPLTLVKFNVQTNITKLFIKKFFQLSNSRTRSQWHIVHSIVCIGVSTPSLKSTTPSFLALNISDFNLIFMWKLQLPLKKSHPLYQQPSPPPKKRLKLPPAENGVVYIPCLMNHKPLYLLNPGNWHLSQ